MKCGCSDCVRRQPPSCCRGTGHICCQSSDNSQPTENLIWFAPRLQVAARGVSAARHQFGFLPGRVVKRSKHRVFRDVGTTTRAVSALRKVGL
ncbi:hypothetical protein CBR_g46308 [Chara braunii]|uniref:Uncharacterized protein n=1 Tax=Chara braunii TaxID=69332 RepID=A0A388M0C1_CHABU|nr:hypothetical protein CBR_g46308 [Chara braunii]|eukprot:GBG87942.1 hypothetical protein CBR_g46308 [Chara braunii]